MSEVRETHYFRNAMAYMFMPRVFPRLPEFMPNTALFAQLMARIFYNVRLLPRGHPYLLDSQNAVFGVRDVMAAAASNLRGGWRNSDQYIIYASFLLGMALLALQFVALFIMLITHTAYAAGPFLSMFVTPDPTNDVAFMMLDKVFQVPGFFGSQLDPAITGSIPPFALAMQALFKFYSGGMLIVALFIVLYYVFALAAETAQTGQPFGRRFPSVYGPMRLVLAILLLLPLAYGYNTGQYVTLLMAKWGSSFATNAWLSFNNYMLSTPTNNPMGLRPEEMIAKPRTQGIDSILNFFYMVHTCKAGYKIAYGSQINDIHPYFVVPGNLANPSSSTQMTATSAFPATLTLFNQGDIVVVFGEKKASYTQYPGNVKPYCGSMTLPIASKDVEKVKDIYDAYFNYILMLWTNADLQKYGENMAYILRFTDKARAIGHSYAVTTVPWSASLAAADPKPAGAEFYSVMRVNMQAAFDGSIDAAITSMRTTSVAMLQMNTGIMDLGWGGAGVWYRHIAEFNGAAADAILMMPAPTKYPMIMEHVASVKKTVEGNTNPKLKFSLSTVTSQNTSLDQFWSGSGLNNPAVDSELANLFDAVYQTVADDQITGVPQVGASETNPVKVMFNFIYKYSGLMDVRENAGVNPIAKLSMLGRTLIDKTIISLGAGTLVSGFGGLLQGAGVDELGAAFAQGGGVLLGFASTGLVIGFVLYYLIPFFPFLYFFMSVSRWVKSIFEAMVAVPLWALAHLRLDGEGVGNAASKGYFLLFEILIRPILILFGLLASMAVFSALVVVLDSIFDLLVWNVAGFDMNVLDPSAITPPTDFFTDARNGIDGLFYTIFYTILVYMIATSCFKLIDLIPTKLMRYLQPVPTFHDDAGDPAQNLVRNVAIGGHMLTGKLGGSVGEFARGTGQTIGKTFRQD